MTSSRRLEILKDRISTNEHFFIIFDTMEDAIEAINIFEKQLHFRVSDQEKYEMKRMNYDSTESNKCVEVHNDKQNKHLHFTHRPPTARGRDLFPVWSEDKNIILESYGISIIPNYMKSKEERNKRFIRESYTDSEQLEYLKDRISNDLHFFVVVDNIQDAREVQNLLIEKLDYKYYPGGETVNDINYNGYKVCCIEVNVELKTTCASVRVPIVLTDGYEHHLMFPQWKTDKNIILEALGISITPKYMLSKEDRAKRFIRESKELKVLNAFDMDDTLVYSKRFEEHIKPMLVNEYLTPEIIMNNKLDDIGISIEELKYEDGRIYFDDPDEKVLIPNGSSWVRKKGRIYIIQPDAYFMTDESMPIGAYKDIVRLYNESENRCIITARNERLKSQTNKVLKKLGLKEPNFGLFMYPVNNFSYTHEYKSNKLLELQSLYNFDEIKYYDDNIKLIKKMKENLKDKNIPITFYKVTKNRYRQV